DQLSERAVRAAARMAAALKSDWIALHVGASDREMVDKAGSRRMERALRLAERLGASSARLASVDIAGEILRYAKRNNVTQIVVGRSDAGRISQWLGRSLSHQLVERAQDVSVSVVAPEEARSSAWRWEWPQPPAYAAALVPAATAVGIAV